MMGFFVGLLTVILVLDCMFLILLVLIQLPKKEAGAGVAFGGGATDSLFGAGSGTALTKITKYAAGMFLGLSLVLSVMRAHVAGEGGRRFAEELKKKSDALPVMAPTAAPTNTTASTGAPLQTTPPPRRSQKSGGAPGASGLPTPWKCAGLSPSQHGAPFGFCTNLPGA